MLERGKKIAQTMDIFDPPALWKNDRIGLIRQYCGQIVKNTPGCQPIDSHQHLCVYRKPMLGKKARQLQAGLVFTMLRDSIFQIKDQAIGTCLERGGEFSFTISRHE
ncbi:hypothetical protein CBM2599_A80095 [Cupriavidus taiwanensis]|nr:hypothetical protein CBM2599_A80095 [Cupriavidus taiwanensis]SOY92450.1 hypothetical protein CBM2600_A90094 [Cupriavidus taiwanensis]